MLFPMPQKDIATPLEFPTEGVRGEYITARVQLQNDQPCILSLSSRQKTGIDNYLAPHTTSTVTYPDNNRIVTWHEKIPESTPTGSNYVLRVVQMKSPSDYKVTVVLSRNFRVK